MSTTKEQAALLRLRVELYGAAQILKGQDLADLKQLISEIMMVLDITTPNSLAALYPEGG